MTGNQNWAWLGPYDDCWVIPGTCASKVLTVSLWLKIYGDPEVNDVGGIASTFTMTTPGGLKALMHITLPIKFILKSENGPIRYLKYANHQYQ